MSVRRTPLQVLAYRHHDAVGDCPAGVLPKPELIQWLEYRKCAEQCDSQGSDCWAKWAEWKADEDKS